MNQQTTVEQMHQLKVHGMAKLYQSISDQPVHQQPEPHTLVVYAALVVDVRVDH